MNWLDIVLLLIVGLSVAAGCAKGFARVGVGFAAAILGLLAAIWFYGVAGAFLIPWVSSPKVANFIGFWLVLGGCMVAGGLLGRLLAAAFRWMGLTWLDRSLGAAFGLVRGLIPAIALVLAMVAFAPKPPPKAVVESRFAPYLIDAANFCADVAPRELKDGFREGFEKIQEAWSEAFGKRKRRPAAQSF